MIALALLGILVGAGAIAATSGDNSERNDGRASKLASSDERVFYTDHNGFPKAEPSRIVQNSTTLGGLEWDSWGGEEARATGGSASIPTCEPNCAEGGNTREELVEVKLTDVRDCGGQRHYREGSFRTGDGTEGQLVSICARDSSRRSAAAETSLGPPVVTDKTRVQAEYGITQADAERFLERYSNCAYEEQADTCELSFGLTDDISSTYICGREGESVSCGSKDNRLRRFVVRLEQPEDAGDSIQPGEDDPGERICGGNESQAEKRDRAVREGLPTDLCGPPSDSGTADPDPYDDIDPSSPTDCPSTGPMPLERRAACGMP